MGAARSQGARSGRHSAQEENSSPESRVWRPTVRLDTTVTRSHFLTVLTTQAMTSVIHDHVERTHLHIRTRYRLASISRLSGAWGFRRSKRF